MCGRFGLNVDEQVRFPWSFQIQGHGNAPRLFLEVCGPSDVWRQMSRWQEERHSQRDSGPKKKKKKSRHLSPAGIRRDPNVIT